MKILIACEESQIVCRAFRAKGHEAYSCDILPCSGDSPQWHIQRDVRELLDQDWDMIIAFPPCTDLSVSGARWFTEKRANGARWFTEKRANGSQQKAIEFFMLFANHPCQLKAIENPVGIMSTIYRKPDQIIQPWMFGHGEVKATCLWLTGLPLLTPTNIVNGREAKVWRMPPSENRAILRSKTYTGIARAMAEQWI